MQAQSELLPSLAMSLSTSDSSERKWKLENNMYFFYQPERNVSLWALTSFYDCGASVMGNST